MPIKVLKMANAPSFRKLEWNIIERLLTEINETTSFKIAKQTSLNTYRKLLLPHLNVAISTN